MSRPTSIEIVLLYDEDPRSETGERLTCLPSVDLFPVLDLLQKLGMAATELTVTTTQDGAVNVDLIARPVPKLAPGESDAKTYQKIDLKPTILGPSPLRGAYQSTFSDAKVKMPPDMVVDPPKDDQPEWVKEAIKEGREVVRTSVGWVLWDGDLPTDKLVVHPRETRWVQKEWSEKKAAKPRPRLEDFEINSDPM
jgi:arylsulfatase A-like enzyme